MQSKLALRSMEKLERDREMEWQPPVAVRELADNDESFITDLMRIFQHDTSRRLQQIGDAILCNDQTKVRAEVHTVKGTATQVRMERVAAICRGIELLGDETPIALPAEKVNQLEPAFHNACSAMSLCWRTSEEASACDRISVRSS